ncbi:MAG TPA: cytochrome-c peroxidase [Polyangia bacterium]|nr:cytochrome-c peroxidase [Polyangia bacterium]
MFSHPGRVEFFLVTVIAGTLGACTLSESLPTIGPGPGSQPVQNPGGGMSVPPPGVAADAGVAFPATDGGSTCVNGVAVSPPRPMGGGLQPQIPATVTHATTPVPPISGGTLLALSDGTTVAASDPDRNQVYIVDLATNALKLTVRLQDGDEPGRLVEDAGQQLHVALRRGGAIATIDPKAGAVTARQAVCSAPRGLAFDKATGSLHVACAGGELVSLPAAGGPATRTLTLDRDLRDVVLGTGGSLLVSRFRSAEVLVVGADGQVSSRLRPGSGTVITPFGTPQMRTPSVAWRMVALDETMGTVVMLHQTGVTDVVDPAAGGYAGIKGCGGIVQPGVTILSQGSAQTPPVAGGLGMASLAVDVAVSPDKTKVALAVAGNSSQLQGPTIVEQPIGQVTQPSPNSCGGGGSNVMGAPPPGQVVSVVYSRTGGVLLAQTREPAALWRSDTSVAIPLATDSRADTGQFIFHVNAGGSLACASCHPEGGEDGRVWNFVCAGARRTQSIRGGISPTAPFHWDGSEANFSDLMNDVFTGRMAGPMLMDNQKSALQAWVDTIPAMPETAGLDSAAIARGKAIFNDKAAGCANCHAGTLLTNNTTVDVGTGRAFQVPSLRGVSWRAPFMHDGCAATLADRFSVAGCGGGDKHGVTSTLTAAQLGDLQTYLQSL